MSINRFNFETGRNIPETVETSMTIDALTTAQQAAGSDTPMIVDAFNYNFIYGFRYATSQMRPFLSMEALRRAQSSFRMRLVRCPGEGYQTVNAYDSIEWRVHVKPGTRIWGVHCPIPGNFGQPQNVQILVGKSQYPVFQRPTMFDARGQGSVFIEQVSYVPLFDPPLIVEGDGAITVTLTNDVIARDLLMVLLCAEPK
jgi:hypothetical protein